MTILPMTLSVTLPMIDKTQVLRTPEACFERVPDFPFSPHYFDLGNFPPGEARVALERLTLSKKRREDKG